MCDEPFGDVIEKTLNRFAVRCASVFLRMLWWRGCSALAAALYYRMQGGRASVLVSDDGIMR